MSNPISDELSPSGTSNSQYSSPPQEPYSAVTPTQTDVLPVLEVTSRASKTSSVSAHSRELLHLERYEEEDPPVAEALMDSEPGDTNTGQAGKYLPAPVNPESESVSKLNIEAASDTEPSPQTLVVDVRIPLIARTESSAVARDLAIVRPGFQRFDLDAAMQHVRRRPHIEDMEEMTSFLRLPARSFSALPRDDQRQVHWPVANRPARGSSRTGRVRRWRKLLLMRLGMFLLGLVTTIVWIVMKHDIGTAVGLGSGAWAVTNFISEGYKKISDQE